MIQTSLARRLEASEPEEKQGTIHEIHEIHVGTVAIRVWWIVIRRLL
jgi:hypothetical protein